MARIRRRQGRAIQYTGIGLSLGAGVGTLIGALIGGWAIAVGVCAGAGVGLVIGAATDAQQRDQTQ